MGAVAKSHMKKGLRKYVFSFLSFLNLMGTKRRMTDIGNK